jgi:hypothetical protein
MAPSLPLKILWPQPHRSSGSVITWSACVMPRALEALDPVVQQLSRGGPNAIEDNRNAARQELTIRERRHCKWRVWRRSRRCPGSISRTARYERGAMIVTSNRRFSEWEEPFGNPVVAVAPLDRLLHHTVVVHIEIACPCAAVLFLITSKF